jgi:hypothetical protein
MPQSSYEILDGSGADVLAALNTLFLAILSQNSGATQPADRAAGSVWLDTSVSPPMLRIRNSANNAWLPLIELGTHAVPQAPMLPALSALGTNGVIARTGEGAVAARTVTAGTGVTVTNGNGVSGNPTVALNIATQAQAQAGTANDRAMTPLRVAEAIAELAPGSIGVGQTWQNLLASRAAGTSYQNTTGRPIMVSIRASEPSGPRNIEVSPTNSNFIAIMAFQSIFESTQFIVPPDWFYRINGNCTISIWSELR